MKTIYRGDTFGSFRPLFIYKFANTTGLRFNLAGATIRTTYKTSPDADPLDEEASITHDLIVDEHGVVSLSNGLVVVGDVSDGVIHEHLTKAESLALPLDVPLYSDVEVTIGDDVITFIQNEPIIAKEAYTNRGS